VLLYVVSMTALSFCFGAIAAHRHSAVSGDAVKLRKLKLFHQSPNIYAHAPPVQKIQISGVPTDRSNPG